MGLHGSGLLRRSVKIRLLVPGLDFILHDQQQLGRPMGHMPPSPSVGHPGLPDPSHVVDIPIKYTHNTMHTVRELMQKILVQNQIN
jgi:hypothetical protein